MPTGWPWTNSWGKPIWWSRPLDPRLGKVPDISSVAVMLDGSPVLIFDVEDLVRSIDNLLAGRRLRKLKPDYGGH
jgi:two-component system sensor histidine kinase and response regulator WspE